MVALGNSQRRKNLVSMKQGRIAAGAAPRVLDLFSGCGGLSLGFQRAGFKILGGLEKDPRAAWTYAENLHRSHAESHKKIFGKSRDISSLTPVDFLGELGFTAVESVVDVLVGGPPCQAYARVGRAKLREVKGHPEAFKLDNRGNLYRHYLEYAKILCPLAIVIENVPDILSYGGRNVAHEIAIQLKTLGYFVNFGLLNAASYGVPQTRRRLYIVALHKDLGRLPGLPSPTHQIDKLPIGYREFGALVSSLREGKTPFRGPDPVTFDETSQRLPRAVTVLDAIGDLPRLTAHLDESLQVDRKQRFGQPLCYATSPLSPFAREMRNGWPGFENKDCVQDHVTRLLPRDYRIFSRMKPGDDYPRAHEIAIQIFEEEVARRRQLGEEIETGGFTWESIKKSIVPPYDPAKFPNKWRKMQPDAPARTLLAHLSHDSYTHIHYDSAQARTISVREAARLQSFPDGFSFYPAMNPTFQMIGNAVPPLMSFRLAQQLLKDLRAENRLPLDSKFFDQGGAIIS